MDTESSTNHKAENNSPAEALEKRFAQRLDELRHDLRQREIAQLAVHSHAQLAPEGFDKGALKLHLWRKPVRVTYPQFLAYYEGQTQPAPILDQALLLYYLITADGTPLAHSWIGFAELPDGRFYHQAFQGYTGQLLARTFANDLAAFERAARNLGGEGGFSFGDSAFLFWALPRVPLLVLYWLGDEEFPPRAQILFDASAGHYLPTDAYAILGGTLTRRLIKAAFSP